MSEATSRILLVDDDPEMGVSAASLLRHDGIELTVVGDPAAAVSRLRESLFDLILLDLGLPADEDGFQLLRQIKGDPATQKIPVIMLTAWTSAEHKVRALDLGATDYLTKPFDGSELRARVRGALRTRQLQEALARANEELQAARDRAEREAKAKADLLAFKSHEIRSFMNGILPNAGFLVGSSLTDEQREYVETIRHSSESILSIVNDILDFSRIESGKLELEDQPFDLRKCVEDALDTMALKAGEKKLDLSYLMEDGVMPRVRGDVVRLRQILVNLISNAVKFTTSGEVAVDIRPAVDRQLHFVVRDTGIGIPREKQIRLFTPFSQADASTSRQYGGSGLGLSISRRLVERMGGRLWLESEEGRGAEFHFTLPLSEASDGVGTSFSRLHSPLVDLRILVVDDNPRIQQVVSTMARRWGSIPQCAGSVSEALALLNAGPGFDVVLLDSTMGEADPAAAVTSLRLARASAGARFILLSPVGTRCSSNLFAAHLTKPLKPAHVRDTVARLVTGSKPASSQPAAVPTTGRLADTYPLRVLLCDDNTVNQKVASRMLSQLGYAPALAGNGVEALKAFDAQHYDLVFMDVQMPEMDGLEATRQLRQRQESPSDHPHCQPAPVIVAMTASAMPGDRDRCLKAGMDDYLSKPVRPDDLRKVVEKWGPNVAANPAPASPHNSMPPAGVSATTTTTNDQGAILDWERLMELADSDRDMLKELVSLYLRETEEQMAQLGVAVASNSAREVKRLAHKCAGGSATIGVGRLVGILRELEHRGEEGRLDGTGPIYEQARHEFGILRDHLELSPVARAETIVS
ncbi:MAG: response regulator [Verrucomicrobia bacterium]|jgi:CheY-like chemotaxis protein/HPt (histidine-containing phosphotransfer) domain-containing protein|nr:response regulator [Verrucomicrobiota bacterium]